MPANIRHETNEFLKHGRIGLHTVGHPIEAMESLLGPPTDTGRGQAFMDIHRHGPFEFYFDRRTRIIHLICISFWPDAPRAHESLWCIYLDLLGTSEQDLHTWGEPVQINPHLTIAGQQRGYQYAGRATCVFSDDGTLDTICVGLIETPPS